MAAREICVRPAAEAMPFWSRAGERGRSRSSSCSSRCLYRSPGDLARRPIRRHRSVRRAEACRQHLTPRPLGRPAPIRVRGGHPPAGPPIPSDVARLPSRPTAETTRFNRRPRPGDPAATCRGLRRRSPPSGYAQAAGLFAEADRRKEKLHRRPTGRVGVLPPARGGGSAQRRRGACRRGRVDCRGKWKPRCRSGPGGCGRSAMSCSPRFASGPVRDRPPAPGPVGRWWRRRASASSTGASRLWPLKCRPTAEAARKAMYERWVGPAGGPGRRGATSTFTRPRSEYAKATGKPADQPGHSTVGSEGGRVVSPADRPAADDPDLLDGPLPSEVTQVLAGRLVRRRSRCRAGLSSACPPCPSRPRAWPGTAGPCPALLQATRSCSPSGRSWSGTASRTRRR